MGLRYLKKSYLYYLMSFWNRNKNFSFVPPVVRFLENGTAQGQCQSWSRLVLSGLMGPIGWFLLPRSLCSFVGCEIGDNNLQWDISRTSLSSGGRRIWNDRHHGLLLRPDAWGRYHQPGEGEGLAVLPVSSTAAGTDATAHQHHPFPTVNAGK